MRRHARVSLRARLLAALLSLALLPTLVFAIFTLDQLNRATDLWYYRPGVDRALESAVEVTRTALTRIEATVLERADEWAAHLGPLPLDAARRDELRGGLRAAGLDFAPGLRARGRPWRVTDQVVPAGVLAADTLDLARRARRRRSPGDRLLRSPQRRAGRRRAPRARTPRS